MQIETEGVNLNAFFDLPVALTRNARCLGYDAMYSNDVGALLGTYGVE